MPKTTPRLDSWQLPQRSTAATSPEESGRVALLYGAFGPLIYSRCRKALGDEARAVAATVEVFLRVQDTIDLSAPRAAVELVAQACERVCREAQR